MTWPKWYQAAQANLTPVAFQYHASFSCVFAAFVPMNIFWAREALNTLWRSLAQQDVCTSRPYGNKVANSPSSTSHSTAPASYWDWGVPAQEVTQQGQGSYKLLRLFLHHCSSGGRLKNYITWSEIPYGLLSGMDKSIAYFNWFQTQHKSEESVLSRGMVSRRQKIKEALSPTNTTWYSTTSTSSQGAESWALQLLAPSSAELHPPTHKDLLVGHHTWSC